MKTLLLIAPVLIISALIIAPAHATSQCGVTPTNLLSPVSSGFFADGFLDLVCKQPDFDWSIKTKVKGDSDVYDTLNTFAPGSQTGWHSHPGPSVITVTEGTLTVYHDDCTFETFGAGQTFTDLGCGDIHNVVNESGAEAKDVAVQIVPHGVGRRIEADDPHCSQVPACP